MTDSGIYRVLKVKDKMSINSNRINGGRAGTRTPGLFRVKEARTFRLSSLDSLHIGHSLPICAFQNSFGYRFGYRLPDLPITKGWHGWSAHPLANKTANSGTLGQRNLPQFPGKTQHDVQHDRGAL